ncbi:MAG: hypothetical protein U5O39_02095 [Gammaproteobacteria bacterium]|nr:hypothetical protein [Gammaproteobacteria bacterium]
MNILPEQVDDDGTLRDLFMHETEGRFDYGLQQGATNTERTPASTRLDERGDRFLVLRDGSRYDGSPGDEAWRVIEYEEHGRGCSRRARKSGRSNADRRSAVPTSAPPARDGPQVPTSELQWRFSIMFLVPVVALMAIPLGAREPASGTLYPAGARAVLLFSVCHFAVGDARRGREGASFSPCPGCSSSMSFLSRWWCSCTTPIASTLDALDRFIGRRRAPH